ncbi:COX15/CtaA family protein [Ilumatobacter coccineus]|uniref:Cytochrome oxidase assembly protein n=1 Tax=Ilumatobacter coccineus (strain NBRC 103263 / KCTC 29153 / YM16-304) TaxID=1313172 RepID=A0A6C7E7S7_ILUCY|nr:COX15/CtaA family protein [Ilumatobacter coccineus]BAN02787.1 hypothetical protein YM304_24730 [Ilumatobacter coccineus YM16-304]
MARQMSVRQYRRLALVTTVGICVLVVAGGVVRLTGSGLGCDDWPNCNDTRFIDVSSGHTAVEQINRLLSGLIGVPTLLLAVGSFFVRGRRGLRWPAIGVLVTVLANGVVGGIAVRGDLHPALVQSHFLLAMLSIAFGIVAFRRAGDRPTSFARTHPPSLLVGALTLAALVTGTVVTGTGPHAGEEDVRRFGFDISNVARIHSVTVLLAIAAALWLAWDLRRRATSHTPRHGQRSDDSMQLLSAWIFVALLQGGVGYTQYFNGVPELLVGAHIALATGLWVLTCLLVIDAASDTVDQADLDDSHARDETCVASPAVEV